MNDDLGDRMKLYEQEEAGRKLMPLLPALARLDGRNFSTYTRGMRRPFDVAMSSAMDGTTRFLVEEAGALAGYTQSDEITLLWQQESFKSQIFFDGKIQKLTSVLAAMATAKFSTYRLKSIPALFDCRVWNVPNREEAANCFLWREQDATKNSRQMAAREVFSDKELFEKSTKEMVTMMEAKGVVWADYPVFFKRGTFFRRVQETRAFTPEELEALPPKHEARAHPGMTFSRSRIDGSEMPPFGRVLNRVEVLFSGATPTVSEISDVVSTQSPEPH